MPYALQNRCLSILPQAALHNLYGPTEAAVDVSFWHCRADLHPGIVPIGRPIANMQIYIVDRHLQAVPIGVAGEIYLGGIGVARGYFNRDTLTAERFIADPFSATSNPAIAARLYKTGDMGRWLADGSIEYLGRNDFQVKLRGLRIELGEIEAQLLACSGVKEAVLLARNDHHQDTRLVAYVVLEEGHTISVEQLRDELAKQLADYMLPSAFVILAALPLTANGKLDRAALPAPDTQALITRPWQAPEGEVEQALAALWQELLKVERVGRQDHFFELGGHSLLAVQLISRLRSSMQIELPMRELFTQPTLAAFALCVQQARRSEQHLILPAERTATLPLSWAQQRLWVLNQLDAAAALAYHMPAKLLLTGPLNRAALQASLDRIVARHESLRTNFVLQGEQAQQVIRAADSGFALEQIALHHLTAAQQEVQQTAQVEEISAAFFKRPFDLAHQPLIRGCLLSLSEQQHILLIDQHHIISDAWSIGVLMREVKALYHAFSQAQADPLAPLAIQYADYAIWQRQQLSASLVQDQLSFWKNHLNSAPELLELPCDRARPTLQTHRGASVPLVLPAALCAGLRELSQRHGGSLFMSLLTGWTILMARLSGQDDIVIGTPTANRPNEQVEQLIGFFVNTLALRSQLHDDPSVAQLFAQVKRNTLDAFANQDVSFEQVIDAIKPARSLSHSPLFQSMLVFDNTPSSGAWDVAGLSLRRLALPHNSAHFDLSLALHESGDELHGELEYASDLFDASTVTRWAEHFQLLLASMVSDDQQAISQLNLLSVGARQQLIGDFNATELPYPEHALIHQLFEAQASTRADSIALIYAGEAISYGEVNRRANQVAHRLIALGVQPDQRVAICMQRSPLMIIALLGILKAGGAYLPLDLSYPVERLAFMLADSTPLAVLSETALQADLPKWDIPLIVLDNDSSLANYPSENPEPAKLGLHAGHMAYIIYTSGSTGQPKGVMTSHRNVVQLVVNEPCIPFLPSDCTAYCANPAFDASTWEIWGGLLNGARILIISQETLLEPRRLSSALLAEGVSILHLTMGLFNQYADLLSPCFAKLRYLLIGGDNADLGAVARVFHQAKPQHFLHAYGPTETTTFTCTYEITQMQEGCSALPVGKPIANTQLYLLDRHLDVVPLGVTGEIFIGGAGVARGYLNRPDLTVERFIDDPFSSKAGARLYRTGDVARFLADGNMQFLGRNDQQVKIRGFRIELGEIESKLRDCAGVREAVVCAREDVPGQKRLVAYVTSLPDQQVSATTLREQLMQSLPEYMLPQAFVMLENFSVTPNGKLDRKALPAPSLAALTAAEWRAPEGELENKIAQHWQNLLGLERVGRDDHFFELGGHSLLAVQFIARLSQELGIELAFADLFSQATLASFAAAVANQLAQPQQDQLSAIALVSRDAPLPLSSTQQRLWFLDQLDPSAGAAYHLPARLHVQGKLDTAVLQATLDKIVARHEILRTRFVVTQGQAYQAIAAPDIGFMLLHSDISQTNGHEQDFAIQHLSNEFFASRFDLAQGPLIRGHLICLAETEHILLIDQHHIISDAWSIAVFSHEVNALYKAFSQGQADPLPPLALQYADYASWQGAAHTSQRQANQANHISFWREHLQAAPSLLNLPTDRPRPAQQSFQGESISFSLPAELSQALRAFSQRHQVTVFMSLLAAWSAFMARMSGQDDVVIGSPIANRQRQETQGMIGFFANTLALRTRLPAELTVSQLLAQVKSTTLAAFAYQDLPFEQVVEALNPLRSLSHSPLFQSMLTLNDAAGGSALQIDGLCFTPNELPLTTTQYDLALNLVANEQRISATLSYASALFDASTMQRWIEHFSCLLQSMLSDDQQAVQQLNLLNTSQRQQLLHQFNATAQEYPRGLCLHQVFEAQVASTPNAIAVEFEQHSISYAELNQRANQVAHYLLALGVQPDQRIAICLERSVEMVVGLLGILKAGAAYVPLDPSYPIERLSYMLNDSAPRALLSSSSLLTQLPALQLHSLALDASSALLATQASENPQLSALQPHHVAYVIYTSGSTGQPKGVMNQHDGVLNRLQWAQSEYQLSAADRVLQKTPFSFDVSVWEFFLPLLNGARLVLARPQGHLDPQYLADLITQAGISVLHFVPSMLQVFVQHLAATASTPSIQLASLRHILCSGEALPYALQNRCLELLPHAALHNLYGPTEAAIDVTFWRCQPELHPGVVPIGHPIANTQIYILDAHKQVVPLGVAGEIHIGGIGVARAYLHRPELTAERFIADPFSQQSGARLYKTGDLGRWLADGSIEYLGRNDFQVKLRGFRIELGEIETQLLACPHVKEAVLVASQDAQQDTRLVAYVVPEAGHTLSAEQLRSQLAKTLADYMLPSAFVMLAALPLNANGKLDRAALPAADISAFITRQWEAPRGDMEQAIAQIWQELLGLERVGRHDQFFDLGGHSLRVVQFIARMRQQFTIELSLKDVFEQPTVMQLANLATCQQLDLYLEDDVNSIDQEIDNLSEAELLAILSEGKENA